ncbi:SH3 domain protein [Aspergillus mulundensis]|uniref:RING-type domain-containing protein n=1 Tax=Aspergillus mulundensis TaxID=1810919 RepID=A0A3D8RYV5_9EURO|nr:hypothetical protein DSM5745_05863 [Aspergillus mulundensis]RDW79011.1 hypothetical protein DSM5745_05863 [Aspergillus mulundensis]
MVLICTDLLFQPLTLLDCLHTFCGSCLKEWFHTQASRRSPSTPRFTCPSCRANVRETRPNATVTTLLDMVLTANPERAKPATERAEIEQRYKHGESVFPSLSSPGNSSAGSDEEDQRILEEVRQLSLQDSRSQTRTTGQRSRQSSRTRRAESTDLNGQREDGRSRRRREEERAARRERGARATGRPQNARERSRRIEHQSSLRSLLSLSDTETMEEEILRQIFEEGLLDDIDLDNLEPGQEEELSERIADAYRRRHMLRTRSQRRQDTPGHHQMQRQAHSRSRSMQRPQESTSSPATPRSPLLEPPVSRPGPSNHQRRLSEQGSNRRRRTSPVPYSPASSSDVTLSPALRTSSDTIPDRSRNSHSRPPPSGSVATRPRRAHSSGQSVPHILIGDRNGTSSHSRTRSSIDSPRSTPLAARNPPDSPSSLRPRNNTSEISTNSSVLAEVNGPRSRPSSSRSNALTQPANSFLEPSISCDRCGKASIQYDLHMTCSQCKDGDYHLCLRCYRLGRGCLDWKGFENSAQAEFVRMRASSASQANSQESQHVLQSFKYSRPSETALRFVRDGRETTSDDPARRLQQGLFCDCCQSSANELLWTCNQCNQGDWGFCNKCVNKGKCCTHPLLPICRIDRPPQDQSTAGSSISEFSVLTISTRCDACSCAIPTSTLRFHCLQCNDGDYDLCANCYLKFVATSKIRKENGLNGWRRCLKGHRMIVVGFESYPEGHRRVIARNLVGGNALKDKYLPSTSSPAQAVGTPTSESPTTVGDWSWKEGSERRKKTSRIRSACNNDRDRTPVPEPGTPSSVNPAQPQSPSTANPAPRRFPPDGGVGLIVHAMWSWYPEEGVHDELMFPRGAEITEAENINDDWYWGCYAGMTGLFPGSHVSVAAEIV